MGSSQHFYRQKPLKRQDDGVGGRICIPWGCMCSGVREAVWRDASTWGRVTSRRRVSTFFLGLFIPSLFLKKRYRHSPQRDICKKVRQLEIENQDRGQFLSEGESHKGKGPPSGDELMKTQTAPEGEEGEKGLWRKEHCAGVKHPTLPSGSSPS